MIIEFNYMSEDKDIYYNKLRKCYFCNDSYYERENIGQLRCRTHPGIIIYEGNYNPYYSCCGTYIDNDNSNFAYNNSKIYLRHKNSFGCCPIDHFDKEYLEEHKVIYDRPEKLSHIDIDKHWFSNTFHEKLKEIRALSIIFVKKDHIINKTIKQPLKQCILDEFNDSDIMFIKNKMVNRSLGDYSTTEYIKVYNINLYNNCFHNLLKRDDYLNKNNYNGNVVDIHTIKNYNNVKLDILGAINTFNEKKEETDKINVNTFSLTHVKDLDDDLDDASKPCIPIPFIIVNRISNILEYAVTK